MKIRLGQYATDVVTGYRGWVIGLATYLTGSRQEALLIREQKECDKGKRPPGEWFEVSRLTVEPDADTLTMPGSRIDPAVFV